VLGSSLALARGRERLERSIPIDADPGRRKIQKPVVVDHRDHGHQAVFIAKTLCCQHMAAHEVDAFLGELERGMGKHPCHTPQMKITPTKDPDQAQTTVDQHSDHLTGHRRGVPHGDAHEVADDVAVVVDERV
jgi:hypothetical protein